MADAAQIVEGMGADIVDVNMGCPVPKIAKHNAGCSLMREPAHAQSVIAAMAKAVKIPVTVKMRAGWNDDENNAPELAQHGRGRRRVGDRRARPDGGAVATPVRPTGTSIARRRRIVSAFPVFGSGDCVEPEQVDRAAAPAASSGVLVGRGVLRNPWILAQAADLPRAARRASVTLRGARAVPARLHRSAAARGRG